MKILIAEDDAVSRAIVKRAVERLGHECLAAKDGREAWNVYQSNPDIEVIISDWMMPRMDGLALCNRVRGLEREGYTFFVFLTSLGSREHLLEGMKAGADEYLTKPLDTDQLGVKLIAASRVTSLYRHMQVEDVALRGGSGSRPPGAAMPVTRDGGRGRPKGKVWDILVSRGKISEEQMQKALEAQRGNPAEIGKTLVSLGFISDADLARAQAERLNLEYVELTDSDVDPDAARLVPEKVLRRHMALPLRVEDGRLVVAMSDPTNLYALEDLRMISGRQIRPVVATEESLQRAQTRALSVGERVSEILEEAAQDTVHEEDAVELGAEAGADEAPVVRLVGSVLQRAVGEGASDIHIEPQGQDLKVRLRVDGVLREVMSIPRALQNGVIARLKILANLDIAERRIPQDGRFSVRLGGRKVDLRVASLPTVYGEEVVLRLLDTTNLQTDLASLGFSPAVLEIYEEVYRRPYGAILVTGPTGSGKSTTLYATLAELNSPERKIITVEDPVEYRMPGVNQVQVNPRAGLTFASGLRSILRSDPDVVMIGEIRDFETAKISVEAALTGHLVLATLHTNDAPSAINRLTDMGVEPFLTSSAVDCVIAQRLARKLCESCKLPIRIDKEALRQMGFPFDIGPEDLRFHEALGCDRCGGTGYRGRLGIYEMMVVTEEIKELALRRASTGEISRAAETNGMVRLRADGLLKAAQGLTTVEEVFRTIV
ncbi:MAG TPA: ATPase, T2SS/T4P/T4SS family [Rubrobacteraceae bacterium]|nr:ATPase, T2SS/T4P/T4SS family [Rubrobacteraceae bacterium]